MILELLEITTEWDTCPCCHEQTIARNTITTPDGYQRLIAGCIAPDCDNFNPAALLGDLKTLQQQNQRLQELNVEQMGQIRELQVQLADTPEQQAENNQSAWLAAMSGTHYDNLLKAQAEIELLRAELHSVETDLRTNLESHLIRLTDALRNLFLHTTMIGIAEGFPIEVQYDENDHDTPQAFNIKDALIQACVALGNDDAELRSYFPEMFQKKEIK